MTIVFENKPLVDKQAEDKNQAIKNTIDENRRRMLRYTIGLPMIGSFMLGGSMNDFNILNEANAQASSQQGNRYGIVGATAPEIKLDYWIDKNGEPSDYSLTAQRGKWVFLKCFQDWCPGCHSSGFPTLQRFTEVFGEHPQVSIIAVQTVFEGYFSNTQSDVRKLQLQYELPITMGHDPGNKQSNDRPQIMTNYRTGGTPWLVLIAPDGQVVFNDYHVRVEALIDYVQKQLV